MYVLGEIGGGGEGVTDKRGFYVCDDNVVCVDMTFTYMVFSKEWRDTGTWQC